MSDVIIREQNSEYSKWRFFSVNERELVTVHKRMSLSTWTWRPSQINWSAIGATDLDTVRKFQCMLQAAVETAEQLDKEYPVGEKAYDHNETA